MSFCLKKDQDKYQEFLDFLEDNKDKKGAIMPIYKRPRRFFPRYQRK